MKDIKVSILVTFYNQEDYVDQAMKCIFEQYLKYQFEVIVGDDGSSDATVSKVQEWQKGHPNISLYVMKRNEEQAIGGFRASRNRLNLIHHVKGEYFIFLDGDDYFSNRNKLQKQIEILDNEDNRDCIACGHNIDFLYPDGTKKKAIPDSFVGKKYDLQEYWNSTMYIHTDTLLIRSSVIPKLPCDLVQNNFNDNMITYLALQNGKIYYLPESMAVYLQTGNGIWTTGKAVVNNLRNMFLYDLCLMINPDAKAGTIKRFGYSWTELFKLRRQIIRAELEVYEAEAEDKRMKNSYQWIRYNELTLVEKIRLFYNCPLKRSILKLAIKGK